MQINMRYYILKKGCEAYSEIQKLKNKMELAKKEASVLAEKYGFKKVKYKSYCWGGIDSFYSEKKVKGYVYSYGKGSPFLYPNKKLKCNKKLLESIENLPIVSYVDFYKVFGLPNIEFTLDIGFSFHEDFELFHAKEDIKNNMVIGIEEIKQSEYHELRKLN